MVIISRLPSEEWNADVTAVAMDNRYMLFAKSTGIKQS